jgi:hypothetical protein
MPFKLHLYRILIVAENSFRVLWSLLRILIFGVNELWDSHEFGLSILNMRAVISSETSAFLKQNTRRYIPEGHNLIADALTQILHGVMSADWQNAVHAFLSCVSAVETFLTQWNATNTCSNKFENYFPHCKLFLSPKGSDLPLLPPSPLVLSRVQSGRGEMLTIHNHRFGLTTRTKAVHGSGNGEVH